MFTNNFNGDNKVQQNTVIHVHNYNITINNNQEAKSAIKPVKKKGWVWLRWLIGLFVSVLPFNSS